jgi:hypothetical protein
MECTVLPDIGRAELDDVPHRAAGVVAQQHGRLRHNAADRVPHEHHLVDATSAQICST